MHIRLALATAALAAAPVFAADFGQEFAKHWVSAKELTVAVAEAMPAESYTFKPNPEEMSFGEQIAHIGAANLGYCGRMGGAKPTMANKPESMEKAAIVKFVGETFDYCATTVGGIKDFDKQMGPEGKQIGVREVMLGAFTHMAHHRGQAEVYLRVKGVKPPSYKF